MTAFQPSSASPPESADAGRLESAFAAAKFELFRRRRAVQPRGRLNRHDWRRIHRRREAEAGLRTEAECMIWDLDIRRAFVPLEGGLPKFEKTKASRPLPVGGRDNFYVNPLGCGWPELIGNPRDARPRMMEGAGEALYGGRLWNFGDEFPPEECDIVFHVQVFRGLQPDDRKRFRSTLRKQKERSLGGRYVVIDIDEGGYNVGAKCKGEARVFVIATFPFDVSEVAGKARRGRPPKVVQQQLWDSRPGRFLLKTRQAVEAFLRQNIVDEPDLARVTASPRIAGLGWTEPKRRKPANERTSLTLGILSAKTAQEVLERSKPLLEEADACLEHIAAPDPTLYDNAPDKPPDQAIQQIAARVWTGMRSVAKQVAAERRAA